MNQALEDSYLHAKGMNKQINDVAEEFNLQVIKGITVKQIVEQYLDAHGFDGLCGENCGCSKDDLFLCDSCPDECEPAYRIVGGCAVCKVDCENRDSENKTVECFSVDKPNG